MWYIWIESNIMHFTVGFRGREETQGMQALGQMVTVLLQLLAYPEAELASPAAVGNVFLLET